ncbi:pilus assembly protein [Halopseudomonas sp. SMJS2]|uniref:TadE/TadG family type IV pilus assembly protein n=1 Tax=Halopseudomonas sp. SMJS2 TaxID=3041098 RepID=UPI002452C15C|nr:pilus assembly protein [Halopseudomonas sp. SMJS2]WGK61764.1 pilus assembly protein [Halopseudomonas sp. SMJS2]
MPFPILERRGTRGRSGLRRQQHGAVAIEFAVLFLAFFTVLYAIIAYSVPLLLTLTFNQLSADAARAVVKVDPAIGQARYAQAVSNVIKSEVESSWLPENWRGDGCDNPPVNTGLTWVKLETPYGFLATESLGTVERVQLHVCLQREYNKDNAIIPILTVFGLDIPSLPQDESGNTTLRGRSTIRL